MKSKLFAFVFLLFWAVPAKAQVDTAWVQRYHGSTDSDHEAHARIAVDTWGNVYVTGKSWGSGTGDDYVTVKYYPNGDTTWVRRYNGPGGSPDEARAIAVDNSGYVYVTGRSEGSGTAQDYATIKYYPNGDTSWVRRYNGLENRTDVANAIAVDNIGNVYVTGESFASGSVFDYATIKYYPNGDTAWVRKYNGPGDRDDEPFDIAVDNSGNVCVTGSSYPIGAERDYTTLKYYPNGDTAWVRRYNGPANLWDEAFAMAVDSSGNVYVTGISMGSGTDYDYATIKYYSNGDTAWVRRYNGGGLAIALDYSDNVYVAGGIAVSGLEDADYGIIEYYPNGDTVWVRRYNGPGDSTDWAIAIAVDSSGNVYVTGPSWGSGTGFDYATIKYYPNGDAAWTIRYNGPANSDDIPSDMAIDNSGNVYVTGYSWGSGTDFDYATIKYYQQLNEPPNSFSLLSPPNKASHLRVVHFDWEDASDPDTFDQVKYDLYVSTAYQFPPASTTIDSDITTSEFAKAFDAGFYYWKVKAKDNCGAERWCNQIRYFMVTGIVVLPADFNGDGFIDLGDVTFAINYLYKSGPAPDPLELGDVNCDGVVNLGDLVYLISYLFKEGPPPGC